jgi:hypothetical protein
LINIDNQTVKQAEAQFRALRALVAAKPTQARTVATGWVGGTSQSFPLPVAASWELSK